MIIKIDIKNGKNATTAMYLREWVKVLNGSQKKRFPAKLEELLFPELRHDPVHSPSSLFSIATKDPASGKKE